jgi:hypothetical protein
MDNIPYGYNEDGVAIGSDVDFSEEFDDSDFSYGSDVEED